MIRNNKSCLDDNLYFFLPFLKFLELFVNNRDQKSAMKGNLNFRAKNQFFEPVGTCKPINGPFIEFCRIEMLLKSLSASEA